MEFVTERGGKKKKRKKPHTHTTQILEHIRYIFCKFRATSLCQSASKAQKLAD